MSINLEYSDANHVKENCAYMESIEDFKRAYNFCITSKESIDTVFLFDIKEEEFNQIIEYFKIMDKKYLPNKILVSHKNTSIMENMEQTISKFYNK